MKKLWGLLSLIPLVAFSHSDLKETFDIEEQVEEALLQLGLEEEVEVDLSQSIKHLEKTDALFFETEGELEECLETVLPWTPEKIKREEMTDYLETKVKTSSRKLADDFADDLSFEQGEIVYEPILETVPKRSSKLFHRPKVIESKESNALETSDKQKKTSAANPVNKPLLSEEKQKKIQEMKEKRKILTNRNVQKRQKNKIVLKSDSETAD